MVIGAGTLGGLVQALLSYKGAVAVGVVAGLLASLVLGKRRTGLCRVLERNGEPVGPNMSFLRQLLHALDCLALGIGWLRSLWHPKRQTFADSILTTVVVKRRGWARVGSSDAPTAEGPPPGGG